MFGLGNLIGPKIGLKMIHGQLENILKRDVKQYELIYHDKAETDLYFKVKNLDDNGYKKYPYDGKSKKALLFTLRTMVEKEIDTGDHLDVLKINYIESGECECMIYYTTKDNETKFNKLIL